MYGDLYICNWCIQFEFARTIFYTQVYYTLCHCAVIHNETA